MKAILAALFIGVASSGFGQLSVAPPQVHYVSSRQYEDSGWIKVGNKILFQQQCSDELPPEIPTGTVFFENVYRNKQRFSMMVEFRDTVIASVTYRLKGNQTDLLKEIGYSQVEAIGANGQWTFTHDENHIRTVIVGDKKSITIVQTAN